MSAKNNKKKQITYDQKSFDQACRTLDADKCKKIFQAITIEDGMNERTMDAMIAALDTYDMWTVMKAALTGTLSIVMDTRPSVEVKEICDSYLNIKQSDVPGHNQITIEPNKWVSRDAQVHTIPASVLHYRDGKLRRNATIGVTLSVLM